MSPDLKKCETEALKLPARERAALAEHLIASLDELEGAENERVWLEEAERRYELYKQGCVSGRPAELAVREARAKVR